jgi:hypothetical protein
MKCAVIWVVMQCSSENPRSFGEISRLRFQILKLSQARYWHETGGSLLAEDGQMSSAWHLFLVFSSLAYSSILKMQAICSFETSGGLRTLRCYNTEGCILKLNLCINICYFLVVLTLLILVRRLLSW